MLESFTRGQEKLPSGDQTTMDTTKRSLQAPELGRVVAIRWILIAYWQKTGLLCTNLLARELPSLKLTFTTLEGRTQ